MLYKRIIQTPTGPFFILKGEKVLRLGWCSIDQHLSPAEKAQFQRALIDDVLLEDLADRILQATEGKEIDFEDIPIPPGTPFQMACWTATRLIPHAHTKTYAQLAAHVGSPHAARAVGQAMRANPLPIVIPCHRVVSASGLGGFCGSRTNEKASQVKTALLASESHESDK